MTYSDAASNIYQALNHGNEGYPEESRKMSKSFAANADGKIDSDVGRCILKPETRNSLSKCLVSALELLFIKFLQDLLSIHIAPQRGAVRKHDADSYMRNRLSRNSLYILPWSFALSCNAWPYSRDPRDRTPTTIIRHWNRLGIDPHVTMNDVSALSPKPISSTVMPHVLVVSRAGAGRKPGDSLYMRERPSRCRTLHLCGSFEHVLHCHTLLTY